MTVENGSVIDLVTYNPAKDRVLLVMLEVREWGETGALLLELQEKFNTYLSYVAAGQLTADHPKMAGKPVQIELRTLHPPGRRELDFFKIVETRYLEPSGILFKWAMMEKEN